MKRKVSRHQMIMIRQELLLMSLSLISKEQMMLKKLIRMKKLKASSIPVLSILGIFGTVALACSVDLADGELKLK